MREEPISKILYVLLRRIFPSYGVAFLDHTHPEYALQKASCLKKRVLQKRDKLFLRRVPIFLFIAVCQFVAAQIPNITISSQFDPEEVTIAINPKNPKQIIAGANLSSSYYSEDGGYNWTRSAVLCKSFNVYGDPVVLWDTAQTAYFLHLSNPDKKIIADGSWVDRIVVSRSTDLGRTYSDCFGFGKTGKKVQDKHWACIDNKTNTIHVTWTQFDKYESKEITDSSIIRYSSSKDRGETWSEPKKISFYTGDCLDSDNTVEGAVPAMGPNGEIYVAWAGPKGLVFQRSLNGGSSWEEKEKMVTPIKNGWDYNVAGVYRTNGLPFTACDLSNGSQRGRIYICWGDEKNGEKNKDVFLVYSDDKGETWTDPILVTYRPNHKEQFMPYMTIDQTTGYVYILYYDRQNYATGDLTDVYMAVSKNGGLKFEYYKINQTAFKPDKKTFFGDYIGLSAVNGQVRPIWMQMDNGKELSVYSAIVNDSIIDNYNKANSNDEITIEKTFKYEEKITIDFSLKEKTEIVAEISKPLDPGFAGIVLKKKKYKAGANQIRLKTKKLHLVKGSYVLTLYYKNKNSYVWITEE